MPNYNTCTNVESQKQTKDKDMDRIRSFFKRKQQEDEYAPLVEEPHALEGSAVFSDTEETPFSWFEYGIFALLGVAMLWAW